jgi:two-component system, NtrC family, sensor kinase
MNLPLTTKIFLGFAAVLITFGAVSASSVLQMRRISEEMRLVSEGYLPLTKAVAQMENAHAGLEGRTKNLIDTSTPLRQRLALNRPYGSQTVREQIREARKTVSATVVTASSSEREFLRNLDQRFAKLDSRYDEHDKASAALFSILESNDPALDATYRRASEAQAIEKSIDSDIKTIAALLEQRIRQRVRSAEQSQARGAWTAIALSLLAAVVGLAATALAGRTLAPIRQLTEAVTRISKGDYSAQVPTDAHDEIGVLAREFNKMAASLRARERELSEKQTALLRAERLAAIGRVTAQITHEIRNPLSSIGLNAEMLEEALAGREPDSSKEVGELLAAITREVDRLTEITEHYLRFARLPKPLLEPWDVNAIVASVLDFCAEENARGGIRVVRRLGEDLPRVLADEGQIRQALLNLVRNAREAMASGGTLSVETRRQTGNGDGPRVEICIADTGVGIAPEEQARIFDPFFSTKERGTGLGLAVTLQIAQEHGGTIRCDSQPGRGTTFVLALRLAPSEQGVSTVAQVSPAGSAL